MILMKQQKMINNIRANTNNVKGSSNYKTLFNNLNRLIADISNNKVNEEKVIKRMKKSIFDLEKLKQKKDCFSK